MFLKILFSHYNLCVYSSCLLWDVSVQALWLSQKGIHPVNNMKNAQTAFLPASVGLVHELLSWEHPWQVAHMRCHSGPSSVAHISKKPQCDLAMLLSKGIGTLVVVEDYWRSFPDASLCFYYFHLSWPWCLSLLFWFLFFTKSFVSLLWYVWEFIAFSPRT